MSAVAVQVTHTYHVRFNAIHQTIGADPAVKEGQQHSHSYRIGWTTASHSAEAAHVVQGWIAKHMADSDLNRRFDGTTTPAALAEYMWHVIAQLDAFVTEVTLTVDDHVTCTATSDVPPPVPS